MDKNKRERKNIGMSPGLSQIIEAKMIIKKRDSNKYRNRVSNNRGTR